MPLHQVNDGTGFQLNYEIIEGILPEDTLFIHGNLASNRWWYPSQKEFTQKFTNKQKGSMIMAEFRGCGKSSAPKKIEEVNVDVLANDFISLVKSLNLKGKVNLVGHSTGGLIVAMMLAKASELFNKAVLLDPVGANGVKFDNSMLGAFETMKTDRALTAAVIGSTIQGNDPESTYFRDVIVEDAFHAIKTVGAWVLQALDGFNGIESISKVQNQVLVLHGENDVLLPMEDSKKLASFMKNGRFDIINGHGHCTNAEDPKLFAELVSKFLFV